MWWLGGRDNRVLFGLHDRSPRMETLDGGELVPRGDFWPNWRERLKTGYVVTSDGCHRWTRATNNRGYGVIWFDGKLHLAHRAAWLLAHGREPTPGLVIDHICENKWCVNADHLRELSNAENIQRAYRHLDPSGDDRRRRNRIAKAKYLAKKRGGDSHNVV